MNASLSEERISSVNPASEFIICRDLSLTPPMLSLSNKADNTLLRFVVSGDRGLPAILNLRLVCCTTKEWVDGAEKLIFRNCTASVQISEQGLKEFLSAVPPQQVSSLSLTCNYSCAIEEGIWSAFVKFWSPKLEHLELKTTGLFKQSSFRKFCFSCPLIRILSCPTLDYIGEADNFHVFLLRLEEIDAAMYDLTPADKQEFFSLICRSMNLKRFIASSIDTFEDLIGVTTIICAKHRNKDFQISLQFNVEKTFVIKFPEESRQFVNCVASAMCSVRIQNLDEGTIRNLARLTEETALLSFCKRIEHISEYQGRWDTAVPRLTDFSNLKVLDSLTDDKECLEFVNIPQNVKRLGIRCGCVSLSQLPPDLTHLELHYFECSFTELVAFIRDLARLFPFLEALHLTWKVSRIIESVPPLGIIHPKPLEEVFFRLLKTLTMRVAIQREQTNNAYLCRTVLLQEFKLPQLSLRRFTFFASSWEWTVGEKHQLKVFDCATLLSLLEGNIANTLEDVYFDELVTSEDAICIKKDLSKVAYKNWIKNKSKI